MPGRQRVRVSVKIGRLRLSGFWQPISGPQIDPARVFTTNGGKIDKQAPHDNRGSLGS